jgi:hypothetical protein
MESDRQRWLEAVSPPISDNPEETVYEEWDCPQVTAVHPYVSRQPDELSLEVADVVNVLRKITDGKISNLLIHKFLDKGHFSLFVRAALISPFVRFL